MSDFIDHLINSGSLYREYLGDFGDDFYDKHWNDFVTAVSSSTKLNSTNTLTDSERQKCQEWLDNNKNSSSGSLWFEMLLDSEHTGSF
tara:strand:+ start:334 stop:597 length:264 start_codon:yes stop_codon:yes gene_type:complete